MCIGEENIAMSYLTIDNQSIQISLGECEVNIEYYGIVIRLVCENLLLRSVQMFDHQLSHIGMHHNFIHGTIWILLLQFLR